MITTANKKASANQSMNKNKYKNQTQTIKNIYPGFFSLGQIVSHHTPSTRATSADEAQPHFFPPISLDIYFFASSPKKETKDSPLYVCVMFLCVCSIAVNGELVSGLLWMWQIVMGDYNFLFFFFFFFVNELVWQISTNHTPPFNDFLWILHSHSHLHLAVSFSFFGNKSCLLIIIFSFAFSRCRPFFSWTIKLAYPLYIISSAMFG